MATEFNIIRQDMKDYSDKITDRVANNKGLEFSHDLVYHQVADYLDRKHKQNIIKNYAIHWFNSHTIVVSVDMTQLVLGASVGGSFSVEFPHLKKSELSSAIKKYDRAMKGI